MMGELFQQSAGVRLTHVPYRGSSTAMNDLIAGQIDPMIELVTADLGRTSRRGLMNICITPPMSGPGSAAAPR
jgi:tripartite-type tricarboxylate transporter receptor subunit TctC